MPRRAGAPPRPSQKRSKKWERIRQQPPEEEISTIASQQKEHFIIGRVFDAMLGFEETPRYSTVTLFARFLG